MPVELRRERMLSLVREREFMRVADLSTMFGISEVTVRTDLASLAKHGSLQRVHGGAIVRDPQLREERSFEEALLDDYAAEKTSIGQHAADTVRSGETIILDVGTSTAAIAKAMVARQDLVNVTVFTSSLPIALELEAAIPRFTVVVTGGTLRPKQHSLVDPMAGFIFDRLNAATVFIGCNGVHPEAGITNVNLPEAGMKRKMLAAAQRAVIVADGSKLGNISVAKIADLSDIDLVITGPSAPSEVVAELAGRGVSVEIAQSRITGTNRSTPPVNNGGNT
jgi:DeoR family transcriptional regulator of aga operon